ncbi:MAG: DNA-processing protein DprA [Pseudomonadales bacterium]|nr:DNA-processing protein DprA [Pseudomonadales bacterium]
MLDERDWIGLALAPGIGAVRWGALMREELAPSARERLLARGRALIASGDVLALQHAAQRAALRILTPADPCWPEPLRALPDPPALLFLRGDAALLSAPQIAVVGARRASRRGREDARWLVSDLAAAGLVVTSGLALGIDGCAHQAALDAGGRTVAVLGSGLDRVHPVRHQGLAAAVARRGALVSEFAPGTPPLPEHFPRRNRIISGLARGVLVVEAGEHSGSMITARLAAAQGREVFVVPSVPRDRGAAGCLRLLREGAVLVRDAQDVLDELGIRPPATGPSAPAAEHALPPELRAVFVALDAQGSTFEALLAVTGLDAAELARRLTELELEGALLRDGERLLPAGASVGGARSAGDRAGASP